MSGELRPAGKWVLALGATLLVLSLLGSSARGAYALSVSDILDTLWALASGTLDGSPEQLVFLNIRLPRLLLGLLAGAGLGLCGALMQALFRNPLADPGLLGVSSAAALMAGVTIVLGATFFPALPRTLGSWALMLMAFCGALGVSLLIALLARASEGTRIGTLLLAGIAFNALAGAGLGLLSFMATDEQLRNLQFWLMGSLGGARWLALAPLSAIVVLAGVAGQALARQLNILALGESSAYLLGVHVEGLKRRVVWLVALCVGAITACTGIIGFVGLVAPHCVRLLAGPDQRVVLPASAMLGAVFVLLADSVARTWVQPAELPLGVLTALVGVPFFLALLRAKRGVA